MGRIWAAALFLVAWPVAGHAKQVEVTASPIPLSTENKEGPQQTRVGALTYRGGLILQSHERNFGGFSGLHISPDSTSLLAVSDIGYWLEASLVYGPDGTLTGLANARLSPMLGPDGKKITGKQSGDAEGLAVTPEGIYVSFEHRHRLWRYPRGQDLAKARPENIPLPDDATSIPLNQGLEALAKLPGRDFLLLTEQALDDKGRIRGWLLRPLPPGQQAAKSKAAVPEISSWPVLLRKDPPFSVTGAATLAGSGGILVLERRFSRLGGLGIKLRHIHMSEFGNVFLSGSPLTGKTIAEFAPGQNFDNFEGLATRRDAQRNTIVYMISDDNFNPFQRTLLLQFRLENGRTGPLHSRPPARPGGSRAAPSVGVPNRRK